MNYVDSSSVQSKLHNYAIVVGVVVVATALAVVVVVAVVLIVLCARNGTPCPLVIFCRIFVNKEIFIVKLIKDEFQWLFAKIDKLVDVTVLNVLAD